MQVCRAAINPVSGLPAMKLHHLPLHERSQPTEKEHMDLHRRPGKTGGFRGKFKPESIDALNETPADAIDTFGYEY